jgi:hypothetical protein
LYNGDERSPMLIENHRSGGYLLQGRTKVKLAYFFNLFVSFDLRREALFL